MGASAIPLSAMVGRTRERSLLLVRSNIIDVHVRRIGGLVDRPTAPQREVGQNIHRLTELRPGFGLPYLLAVEEISDKLGVYTDAEGVEVLDHDVGLKLYLIAIG